MYNSIFEGEHLYIVKLITSLCHRFHPTLVVESSCLVLHYKLKEVLPNVSNILKCRTTIFKTTTSPLPLKILFLGELWFLSRGFERDCITLSLKKCESSIAKLFVLKLSSHMGISYFDPSGVRCYLTLVMV